jgi:hypothetical protein
MLENGLLHLLTFGPVVNPTSASLSITSPKTGNWNPTAWRNRDQQERPGLHNQQRNKHDQGF